MQPFLKWAGGKRWLTAKASDIFPDLANFNRYFEPFLGGGAVFFHFQPNSGLLSDVNEDLINSYKVIKDDWESLYRVLRKYNRLHCSEFYYNIRSSKPKTPLQKAARFIYLNRTCWNGLYRVNQKGEFNVPIGTKTKVILEADNFKELSTILGRMKIETSDFETTIDKAGSGDFVFIDPPYTVKHNLNGFIKYNETLFSWDDQIRLRNAVSRAVKRGASVLILNANHNSIQDLYDGIGEKFVLNRASIIAGDAAARGVYSELAIKCYS